MEPDAIHKALAEIESRGRTYKGLHDELMRMGNQKAAAQYSRIAGAYEQCHIIVCESVGLVSKYRE